MRPPPACEPTLCVIVCGSAGGMYGTFPNGVRHFWDDSLWFGFYNVMKDTNVYKVRALLCELIAEGALFGRAQLREYF